MDDDRTAMQQTRATRPRRRSLCRNVKSSRVESGDWWAWWKRVRLVLIVPSAERPKVAEG
jgi:hypothetical protein